ncbi:MAG: hypothetical protein ACXWCG_00945, partial [Flavitalea sp.]
MHRIHSGLTVEAEVDETKSCELKAVLKKLQGPVGQQPANFSASDTTLFASAVILPKCDKEKLPETLVFTTTYCGPLRAHLRDLDSTNRKHLLEIFSHCKDFHDNQTNHHALINYLEEHKVDGAFNSRCNCLTKKDIEREKALRAEIENHLDRLQNLINLNELTALEVKYLIERHLKINCDQFDWAYTPYRKNIIEFISINRAKIADLFLAIVTTVLVFIALYTAFQNEVFEIFMLWVFGIAGIGWLLRQLFFSRVTKPKYNTASRPAHSVVRDLAHSQLHPV